MHYAMPTILTFVPNLLFGVQVANAVRAAGGEPRVCPSPAAFQAALNETAGAAGAVVDLSNPAWEPVIRAAATAQVPVFAFGPHLDSARLKAARQAGAQRVTANSAMAEALPKWLARQLAPAGPSLLENDGPDDEEEDAH